VALAHLAVEVLHAQLRAGRARGAANSRTAAQEVPVLAHLEHHAGLGRCLRQRPRARATPRLGHHHALDAAASQRRAQGLGQACSVPCTVLQRDAFGAQALGKVPHGAQEERDAHLAGGHVRGLLARLAHPGQVPSGIEAVPGAGVAVELVAQDHHELPDGGAPSSALAG
jgi:hypothetical protein